ERPLAVPLVQAVLPLRSARGRAGSAGRRRDPGHRVLRGGRAAGAVGEGRRARPRLAVRTAPRSVSPAALRLTVERLRTLLESPAPAVLTTYREDGSALVAPVWFRWTGEALEVVIAEGDVKLRNLARDPRCVLVVFETVPPFRGVEVRGEPELVEGD